VFSFIVGFNIAIIAGDSDSPSPIVVEEEIAPEVFPDELDEIRIELAKLNEEIDRLHQSLLYTLAYIDHLEAIKEASICKESVGTLDLRTLAYNIRPEQLDSVLLNDLYGKGYDFLKMGKEYHINAYFIAAVAALESGWGQSAMAQYSHNYFGMLNSEGGPLKYDSFNDNLEAFCKLISMQYLCPDGRWHKGYTVYDVSRYYNGYDKDGWASKVESLMVSMYEEALEWQQSDTIR